MKVEYAKYIGPKVLKFYEEYFDIKFPLPKMDMIAIPDFSAGAMENWVMQPNTIPEKVIHFYKYILPQRV